MIVLGLTGSIGMGKSATCEMFRVRGVDVQDSDAAVHQLYGGEAVPLIEAAFPGTTHDGRVDRALLSTRVLGKGEDLRRLEAIVHPLVRERERQFLSSNHQRNRHLVVLDIPLLFETRDPTEFDVILVASAPHHIQRKRVLNRPGMTVEKFETILGKQLPDAAKRQRAHFVIDTGRGFSVAAAQVNAVLRSLACKQ